MATKEKEAILQIIISDDEDEENTRPLNSNVACKDKERKEDKLNKPVISIVIPDEDDATCATFANQQNADCHVSSSTLRSPWKKFSEQNITKLKALVKLKKLDLGSCGKLNGNGEKPTTATSSDDGHLKLQVKLEKEESDVYYQQSQTTEMGIFESLNQRFSPVKQEPICSKKLNNSSCRKQRYQESTSINERFKSPPSSPSLRQSKLTEESFSPKKKPNLMYGCPRQEQPLHYDTPLYCAVPLRRSILSTDPSQSKNFTATQMNSIQALIEENFHQSVLNTISSIMSQHRKPPPTLVFHLLHNILLAKQSSSGAECFRILRQIQVLHPAVPAQMMSQKITWEFFSMVVNLSECTVGKCQSADSSLALNASLALSFLISTMEEEAKMKKFSLVKTSAYRLLSVIKRLNNIRDVAQWIGCSVARHYAEQSDHGCGHNLCPVSLLQRMLMLSLLVSERPEDSAARIAEELVIVYLQLQSIEQKAMFLQSMQSHLVRSKVIEVIVSNCPSPAEQDNKGLHGVGFRRILFIDFKRFPPDHLSLNDDAVCSNTTNCEEFVMILAYWLQSLVFCQNKSHQKNPSEYLRMLSMDDVDVLLNIDQEVWKLRERLEDLCSPSPLTTRSYQLLDMMSALKSIGLKLP